MNDESQQIQVYCRKCRIYQRHVRNGRNKSGSRRFLCKKCGRANTPRPKLNGKEELLKDNATRLYLHVRSYRAVARQLRIHHQTVINWVRQRQVHDKWYAQHLAHP